MMPMPASMASRTSRGDLDLAAATSSTPAGSSSRICLTLSRMDTLLAAALRRRLVNRWRIPGRLFYLLYLLLLHALLVFLVGFQVFLQPFLQRLVIGFLGLAVGLLYLLISLELLLVIVLLLLRFVADAEDIAAGKQRQGY